MKNFFIKQMVVAAFVIIGVAVLVSVTLIMGKNRMTGFQPVIVYRSIFKNTRGIYTGSEVTIHGVRTGNVINTKILQDGKVEISFTTLKNHAFIINQSSMIQLKTLGVLGDRYVDISTSDLAAPPLEKGALIPSQSSSEIINLFSDGKKAGDLKDLIQSTKIFLEEFSQTVARFNRILKKVEQGEGSLGALINNRDLYNRILNLLGEKPRHKYIKDLYQKSAEKSKSSPEQSAGN